MSVKRKIILSILIVLIGTSLISYFIILPTVNDIKAIKEAVYLERVDLEVKYLKGQLLNKALDDFEKTKTEKDKLTSVFIIKGEELEFITSLEQIAENYNIAQELKLGQGESMGNKQYSTSRLSVNAQGPFNDLLKYLDEIRHLNYYYNIDEIDIRTGNTLEGGLDQITMNFSGNIFIVEN